MFSEQLLLMQQEGFLINSLFRNGFTSMAKANLQAKGDFYLAFFNLSTALERTFKLIFIQDRMIENNLSMPTSVELKKIGHDLEKLMSYSLASGKKVYAATTPIIQCELDKRILNFLSSFSKGTRYHNLDKLTSGSENSDPLLDWGELLVEVALEDISEKRIKKAINDGDLMEKLLENKASIISHGLDKRKLGIGESIGLNSIICMTNPCINLRLTNILRSTVEILVKQSEALHDLYRKNGINTLEIPFWGEFFKFIHYSDAAILKKKKWDI